MVEQKFIGKGYTAPKMTAIIYIACIAADNVKTLQEIYKKLNADEGLIKKNIEKINKLIKSDYHNLKEKS